MDVDRVLKGLRIVPFPDWPSARRRLVQGLVVEVTVLLLRKVSQVPLQRLQLLLQSCPIDLFSVSARHGLDCMHRTNLLIAF